MEDHVMIHDERERLVERFAAGRMTPTEKSELSERAVRDERLARLIRAEETITSAVERDRAGIILAGSHEPSARILGSLAASSLPTAGGPIGGLFSASAILKGIVGVVGLLGLSAGLYFFTPLFDTETSNAERAQAQEGSATTTHDLSSGSSVVSMPSQRSDAPSQRSNAVVSRTLRSGATRGDVDKMKAVYDGMTSVMTGGSRAMTLLGGVTQRLERTREMGVAESPFSRSNKIGRIVAKGKASDGGEAAKPTAEKKRAGRKELNDDSVGPFDIKNR